MPEEKPGGFTRRDMLKRSAVVGGSLVWAAPAVQTFARPAFAQQASPECTVTVLTRVETGPPPVCETTTYAEGEDCCDCITFEIEVNNRDAFTAAAICFGAGRCLFNSPISTQPC